MPVRTAASAFESNRKLSTLTDEAVGKITPTPLQASFGPGVFTLGAGASIGHPPELWREARFLRDAMARLIRQPLQVAAADQKTSIALRLNAELDVPHGATPDEAYRLAISSAGVEVTGRTPAGVFYGLQTLLQLVPVGTWRNPEPAIALPLCEISDAPRFGYRGLLLDVARNFSDKSTVLAVLDLMALYKLCKFHFHLTDDEGWRVPIASLPELTEVGSRRGWRDESECLPPSFGSGSDVRNLQGSGHYTRDEFIEILRYADARHIEVIPEIDLPGHARAAIRAMHVRSERLRAAGQLDAADTYSLVDPNDASKYESVQMWRDNVVCIGLESCYTFIDTVVRDVKALYEDADVPLRTVHVGGDEVPEGAWVNSPVCRAFMREQGMTTLRELEDYFFTRLRDILGRHGLGMAGWEEVALVTEQRDGAAVTNPNPRLLGAGVRPHVWNNVWGWGREDIAYRLANAGYEVVLCNVTNLYLDLAYEKDPGEPGYYWGGFLDTRKVFEFCPFDIYTLAKIDLLGNPLDPKKLAKMARLTPEGKERVLGLQGHLWGAHRIPARAQGHRGRRAIVGKGPGVDAHRRRDHPRRAHGRRLERVREPARPARAAPPRRLSRGHRISHSGPRCDRRTRPLFRERVRAGPDASLHARRRRADAPVCDLRCARHPRTRRPAEGRRIHDHRAPRAIGGRQYVIEP